MTDENDACYPIDGEPEPVDVRDLSPGDEVMHGRDVVEFVRADGDEVVVSQWEWWGSMWRTSRYKVPADELYPVEE